MSFEQALTFVLAREGGYVNDPADPGGETNLGISKRAYPNLDIRNLTPELAGLVYHKDYWLAAGCETLTPGIALVVFDSAVNCGVTRAVGWLHEFPDVEDYLWHRLDYYQGLAKAKPPLGKFLGGWLKRMILLRNAIATMT